MLAKQTNKTLNMLQNNQGYQTNVSKLNLKLFENFDLFKNY